MESLLVERCSTDTMCAAGAELLIPQRMELAIGENLVTGVTTEAAVVPELSSETEPNPSDQLERKGIMFDRKFIKGKNLCFYLLTSITFVEGTLDVALLAEQTEILKVTMRRKWVHLFLKTTLSRPTCWQQTEQVRQVECQVSSWPPSLSIFTPSAEQRHMPAFFANMTTASPDPVISALQA